MLLDVTTVFDEAYRGVAKGAGTYRAGEPMWAGENGACEPASLDGSTVTFTFDTFEQKFHMELGFEDVAGD